MIKTQVCCVAFVVLGGTSWAIDLESADTARQRPNILFLLADDLGWADVGFHDSDKSTPNIDRLAATGVRIEQHYVWPTCSPTRAAFLTGREPSRFGVFSPLGDVGIPATTMTLPAVLRNSGYATHISGKWHLGAPPEYRPLLFGFDSSYGYFRGQIDPYTHLYKTGARTWHRNDKLLDEPGHATDLIAQEAIRIIQSAQDKPFFLYVPFSVPHFPLSEPDEWSEKVEDRISERWRRLNAASVAHMDDAVGRIVHALEQAGLRDNTLIVFASDNGGQESWTTTSEQYGGRYEPHLTLGDNRPLRGWKAQLYEGGIRTPCCINWPSHLPAGEMINSPTCIIDWMPTFCHLAGINVDADWKLSGQDLWPMIADAQEPPIRTLTWRTPSHAAIRHGDWKLITDKAQQVELFDIANDPNETQNVADTHPQRVAELTTLLDNQQKLDIPRIIEFAE